LWKVQNVNELHDKIVRAAECITNEMTATMWCETDTVLMWAVPLMVPYIEIYWAHQKLCDIQYLTMYRCFQHTLWVEIYFLLPFKARHPLLSSRWITNCASYRSNKKLYNKAHNTDSQTVQLSSIRWWYLHGSTVRWTDTWDLGVFGGTPTASQMYVPECST
jgi:hypothetical protein